MKKRSIVYLTAITILILFGIYFFINSKKRRVTDKDVIHTWEQKINDAQADSGVSKN